MSMRSILKKASIVSAAVLTVAAVQVPCMLPVGAQGALLSGSIENNGGMPTLIRQVPAYDAPVYSAPVARVPYTAGTTRTIVHQPVIQRVYVRDDRTYFQKHPKVKAAAIGAGVGTAAGAVTGAISGHGIVRGGLIGAGTGAGVGLVRSSQTMKRHPIVNDVATGSLVGLGLGAASGRGGRRAIKGTGIGAAVGLGVGLLRNGLH